MDSTKNQPATPLPFTVEQPNVHLYLKGANGAAIGERYIGSIDERQDLAYIAHAANAYPQLVAQLRALIAVGPSKGGEGDSARALLRALGEL
jgi:hypothetical protein